MLKIRNLIQQNNRAVTTIIGLLGVLMIIIAVLIGTEAICSVILLSVGCSVLSTAIINIINSVYQIQQNNAHQTIQKWGIDGIYETRAEINPETNDLLKHIKTLEICAMGLSNFRDAQSSLVKKRISEGMQLKILTMDPDSPFLTNVDKAENHAEGYTRHSIEQLFVWLAELKSVQKYDNQIEIRTYNHYPHDFYYCMDGIVYTGPYLPKSSQQTITYKFLAKSKGAALYQEHFEKVWSSACKAKV